MQQVVGSPPPPAPVYVPPPPKPPPRDCTFSCGESYDGGLPLVQVGDPTRTKQWPCARHRELGKRLGWEEDTT